MNVIYYLEMQNRNSEKKKRKRGPEGTYPLYTHLPHSKYTTAHIVAAEHTSYTETAQVGNVYDYTIGGGVWIMRRKRFLRGEMRAKEENKNRSCDIKPLHGR